jgi:sorbitol/mannitol transport system substrate-binding protein
MKLLAVVGLCFFAGWLAPRAFATTDLVVATVNNAHLIEMQRLSKFYEQEHPDIHLKWVTLEEAVLRQRLTMDLATDSGQFDVISIGMYETLIWGKRNWLVELQPDAAYDVDDLLPPIRAGLTVNDKLYAAPFYGESSMTLYRADLLKKAGLTMPARPTWAQIRDIAAKIHDPANHVYGICLRGKAGWGDNVAFVTTMANSFGAQWFDLNWKPQLTSPAWKESIQFYVDLLKQYGPPGSSSNSFNEILALFNEGKCGIWVDATIAASFVSDPEQSKVAQLTAFAPAPIAKTEHGSNWLWSWALGVPKSSKKAEAAKQFVYWATSKDYIKLVAREAGWHKVPTGTRKSTYANREFQKAAPYAAVEQKAIFTADPNHPTLPPSPYVGVQFAAIPEFQSIGVSVGQQLTAALLGKATVDEALATSQQAADREMRKAGYYK